MYDCVTILHCTCTPSLVLYMMYMYCMYVGYILCPFVSVSLLLCTFGGGSVYGCFEVLILTRATPLSPPLSQGIQELKTEIQRLKDENGALIRVVGKLSRAPFTS